MLPPTVYLGVCANSFFCLILGHRQIAQKNSLQDELNDAWTDVEYEVMNAASARYYKLNQEQAEFLISEMSNMKGALVDMG